LRRIRCALARTLEVLRASAAPGERVAVGVSDGDHRVVESRANVGHAPWHRLALAPPLPSRTTPGRLLRHACPFLLKRAPTRLREPRAPSHRRRSVSFAYFRYFFAAAFLRPATVLRAPRLVRAFVRVR